MKKTITADLKVGILGGGQLGKMLLQPINNWSIQSFVLDPDAQCSSSTTASFFFQGDFKDYKTVYDFGKKVDMLTIEIEHVNVEALLQLEKEGITVHPNPTSLKIIQDKGSQKEFYKNHKIPTSPFLLFKSKTDLLHSIKDGIVPFPFVQKSRMAGYDGKGVAVINSEGDINKLLDGPCLVEDKVAVKKEISVIASRNESGEVKCFPLVEMDFNPNANLVETLICPSNVEDSIQQKAFEIANKVINDFNICGVLAVEMFIDDSGNVLVNEVAPRPHNSGHHTIESVVTSQYEQHLRGILGLHLGSTELISPAVMINILGEEGFEGTAIYKGFDECASIEGVKIHLYGKKKTKPFRKMGHVTIIDKNISEALKKADFVKKTLKVIA